jgi:hypothetical protein
VPRTRDDGSEGTGPGDVKDTSEDAPAAGAWSDARRMFVRKKIAHEKQKNEAVCFITSGRWVIFYTKSS